jgi:phage terminase large subunit-like protein
MLSTFATGGYSSAVWRCGRRGGKSLLADLLVLYDVALRDHLRNRMRRGEARVAAIVAPRIEQARAHIRNCSALVAQSPLLRRLLVSETSDELEFANGAAIRAYPCSARTIRGDAWSLCVLDELAHFMDSTEGPAAGDRALEASLPALAQLGATVGSSPSAPPLAARRVLPAGRAGDL